MGISCLLMPLVMGYNLVPEPPANTIPFIILMVLLIPLSRAIVGTGSGLTGSFVALIFGTVPFFSRQIESVLSHLDSGLIEASKAMGLRPLEIIFGVYLRESIPGITRVTMITFVSFIGITAIAGAIGAGGIGDFAIRYGYQMGYRDMIWLVVAVVLLIISIVQGIGKLIIKKTTFYILTFTFNIVILVELTILLVFNFKNHSTESIYNSTYSSSNDIYKVD